MITPLIVPVTSMIHFATQHQLQKREGRLMTLANPLQYEVNVREHIPSIARGSMLLRHSNNMITPPIVLVARMIHFATQHSRQKREGRLMTLSNPLQYEVKRQKHIYSNARGSMLLRQSNNMITTPIVLVASMNHFATQHQLQKREGRLMTIANPLQYEMNVQMQEGACC